jgi:hypothetical protein
LKNETWFELAWARGHGTKSGADPLNIRVEKGRIEVRKNFFSNRSSRHGTESHRRLKTLEVLTCARKCTIKCERTVSLA